MLQYFNHICKNLESYKDVDLLLLVHYIIKLQQGKSFRFGLTFIKKKLFSCVIIHIFKIMDFYGKFVVFFCVLVEIHSYLDKKRELVPSVEFGLPEP